MVASSKVTPVQKVIELLNGMLEKGKKEKQAEQVQYAAFKQFCDDTIVDKKRVIEEAEEQIEILNADIQKYTADAEQLAKEIAEHEADIATWTGDVKAATKVREIEKVDYEATHKDYSESVAALNMAIEVLKKGAKDKKQESSLMQVAALKSFSLVPDEAKHAIDTFLAQDPDAGLDVSAPEANAYESQSHGIIEMLQKLLDKFIEERTTLEKDEINAKHAFEMLMQDLKSEIANAEEDLAAKKERKAKKLQKKADAEGDLQD